MTSDYPVLVEVTSPRVFERVQLLLRIALSVTLGWIGITEGWLALVLFGALPVIASIAVSSAGVAGFQTDVAPRMTRVLRWWLQFSAYMMLLVDRFPTGGDHPVRVDIQVTGRPTPGTALLRLLVSIPSGLVLCFLSIVSGLFWFVAAIVILVGSPMPTFILGFQRGVLRWQARLLAYHASLVDEYPPFAFDSEDTHSMPLGATGAP